ncbi:MAG TPA: hypothetical protein VM576_01990 [Xanthomonadaceae bacterium]|jgi:hypothetical protein|nr:hypothetical protein [Xanthomonadaceae bacterium]
MAGDTACTIRYRRTREGGLRVWVAGARSPDNTVAYWQRIVELVNAQRPHWLLLIDELAGPELSADQWRTLVASLVGKGLEPVRIAHVKPSGLAKLEYCELHAREHGFIARAFVDAALAERWLRYGETDEPLLPAPAGGSGRV